MVNPVISEALSLILAYVVFPDNRSSNQPQPPQPLTIPIFAPVSENAVPPPPLVLLLEYIEEQVAKYLGADQIQRPVDLLWSASTSTYSSISRESALIGLCYCVETKCAYWNLTLGATDLSIYI